MNPIQVKLNKLRGVMAANYIDRTEVIDGLICAVVSRQHVFMLGPPGVAKSEIADTLAAALGGKCLKRLVGGDTFPDEIWGPMDLLAFDKGELRTVTKNFLPEAQVVFLDEIWRGSSVVLNGLLMALNEREWIDNGEVKPLPLRTMICASNTLPDADDCAAIYDRIALRFHVGRLTRRTDRKRLLKMNGEIKNLPQITSAELDEAYEDVRKVKIPDAVLTQLLDVWDALLDKGYDISERRWRQILILLQATAYIDGRDKVNPVDLELIIDCAWDRPDQRSDVAQVVLRFAAPNISKGIEILDAAKAAVKRVPTYDGTNGVEVSAVATDVRTRIKELETDLMSVVADTTGPESERLASYVESLHEMRAGIVRQQNAAIEG